MRKSTDRQEDATGTWRIVRLHELPLDQLPTLIDESQEDGFWFLQRLRDEWVSGANRFEGIGEALFACFAGPTLVGVGGINRQTSTCGRLRRFYVRRDWRRKGIGRALVGRILSFAALHYAEVVLHTESASADVFYRVLGFSRVPDSNNPTHRIPITHRSFCLG